MSLSPLYSEFLAEDFRPQAILNLSESEARKRFTLEKGIDDLDEFVGAALLLDGQYPLQVKRYAGHPPDTFTVYLPEELRNVDQIVETVHRIVDQLDLPESAVIWDRSRDTDL